MANPLLHALYHAKAWLMRNGPMMMSCAEFDRFIDAYLDGELDARTRKVFEWHMATCPPCRDYVRGYRGAVDLSKECLRADDPVPDSVPDDLVAAILAARKAGGSSAG